MYLIKYSVSSIRIMDKRIENAGEKKQEKKMLWFVEKGLLWWTIDKIVQLMHAL